MFPLLPALILLLLQGHLPNERGLVSANLDALPWSAVARNLDGDPSFGRKLSAEARAWIWLLSQPKTTEALPSPEARKSTPLPVVAKLGLPDGKRRSDRTRDGPLVLA